MSLRPWLLTLSICLLLSCSNTPENQFDKIIFDTSTCFGTCPAYHLELNQKTKFAKLHAGTVFKKGSEFFKDLDKMGYFEGLVNDTLFDKLSNILKDPVLDTIKFGNETCCDGSIITIILYRGSKRRVLRSMFPPVKANPLIGVLYEICKTTKFNRTEKFEVENVTDIEVKDIRYPPKSANQK